jgi:basic membrane lipoprotein Med (substrate-binding protein (PBP1-ABC) superfamily)
MARFFSHVFLTGIVWNWEPIITDIAESVHNGTWAPHSGQDWWYGLARAWLDLDISGNLSGKLVLEIMLSLAVEPLGILLACPGDLR